MVLGPLGAGDDATDVAGVLGGSGGNADDSTTGLLAGSLAVTSFAAGCVGTEILSMPGVDFFTAGVLEGVSVGVTDAVLLGVAAAFFEPAAIARGPEGIATSLAFPFSRTGKSSG